MYKKIVVSMALDHGIGARAIDIARSLLAEGGEIIAVHILEAVPSFVNYYVTDEHADDIRKSAEEGIAERIGDAKDAEIVVMTGHPGQTITDYARSIQADCIIVGSHKPGLKDFFLGSTAARVVRHAPCSVHVIR